MMERHKYQGIINVDRRRPDARLIEGFSKHDVCKIGDAMGAYGLMNYQIKPIAQNMRVLESPLLLF